MNPICASCCLANAALKLSNESGFGLNVGIEGCAAGFGCGLFAVLTVPAGLKDGCSVIQRSSSVIGISCTGVGAVTADAPLHWCMTVFPHACVVICGVRAISSGSVVTCVLLPLFCCCFDISEVCGVQKQVLKNTRRTSGQDVQCRAL